MSAATFGSEQIVDAALSGRGRVFVPGAALVVAPHVVAEARTGGRPVPLIATSAERTTQLLRALTKLAAEQRLDEADDQILREIEGWADADRWNDIDDLLWEVDVDELHEDLTVALLMATYPMREHLAERVGLVKRFEDRVRRTRPSEQADQLLVHLR